MAKKKEWEILSVTTGITWHDRRRDTECTRVEIRTPYTAQDAATWTEAQELVQGTLGRFLGDMTKKPNKTTRELVFRRMVSNFNYQYVFRGGSWIVTFKTVEDVPVAELEGCLDKLNGSTE